MFDHSTGTFIPKPDVWPVKVSRKLGRVRIRIDTGMFDLEIPEAMALANRLVDAAEEVTTGEA